MNLNNENYELKRKIGEEERDILLGTSYSFIVEGPPFVRGLENLKEEGYKLIFPIGYDSSPGPKEMYVYSTDLITISLIVDSKEDFHKGKINFINNVGRETIEPLKQKLEEILKTKIIDKKDPLFLELNKKLFPEISKN